jgi:hypothetical protein
LFRYKSLKNLTDAQKISRQYHSVMMDKSKVGSWESCRIVCVLPRGGVVTPTTATSEGMAVHPLGASQHR